MKKLIFCLITVVMLVMVMLPTISPSPVVGDRPIPWPTISEWEELATDDDENCNSFRDVVALYYAVDSDYIYLRMETDTEPGWPSTGSQGVARYKWWFDINGTEAYVHGTSVENAEFLLILEDRTDKSNDDGSRDKWGEITLMDDLANIGFAKRWNKGGSGGYITNTTDSGGPSSYWVRELGYGMPVVGGPQGVNGTDIGYRISGNFVDMYVSRMRLGDPTSVCLIWATDNQNPNLDQAPDCDRPEQPNCIMLGKDYGDAPDPKYPTRLASDGARHTASNITLGALIDVELDGIQSPDATGDDHSNDDDEDGVVLPPALVQGQLAKVTVNVSADGYLDAWVDFNDNGNWSDSDEQIFDMRLLSAGANNLNFTVPFSATVTNQTFARFRFSSAGNLSYVGLADDGEVEDYQVAINEALNLTCDVSPNPTKLDHATNFTAEATGGVPPYEWVWTVDGEEVAWVQNTIFTFDAGNYTAGNYTVCVNVTDSLDNKDQCCHEVMVHYLQLDLFVLLS
jgi:hypothetical protein